MLTDRGAVGVQMRIQLLAAPVWVVGLLLGAQHSLAGMAMGINAALLVRFVLLDRAMRECLGLGTGHVLKALLLSACCAAARRWPECWRMQEPREPGGRRRWCYRRAVLPRRG